MTARIPATESHNRITAADITVDILTVLAFAGLVYCVLDALRSL